MTSYIHQGDVASSAIGQTMREYAEPEWERRSLGKELAHHVELTQELHEQIGQLTEALGPLLAPEQTGINAVSGDRISGAPHSEMVSRAESHGRSLVEATDRIRDLRSRIEL